MKKVMIEMLIVMVGTDERDDRYDDNDVHKCN